VRSLAVVALHEVVEAGLLLQHVAHGWFGGFLLQRQVNALVATVLGRVTGLDLAAFTA